MRITLALAALALTLAACGGDGSSDEDGGGTPAGRTPVIATGDSLAQHDDALRDTAEEMVQAFLSGDADAFYDHFSSSFHDRCDREDFRGILALAQLFIGDLSDKRADVEITGTSYEDDRAFVTMKIDIEGVDFDEDEDASFSDYFVYEDGEWKADTDDPRPCDLGEGLFGPGADATPDGGDGARDGTPVAGGSRASAVTMGQAVTTGDLRVTVLRADLDAAAQILAAEEFAEPPSPGNRYVLISVRAEHAGSGDGTVSVSASSFELTGSRNVVYDTFSDQSRCSFFMGDINGEMFPGGSLDGDVCFQVPGDETGLILIVSPTFSFDGSDRRYLKLQ